MSIMSAIKSFFSAEPVKSERATEQLTAIARERREAAAAKAAEYTASRPVTRASDLHSGVKSAPAPKKKSSSSSSSSSSYDGTSAAITAATISSYSSYDSGSSSSSCDTSSSFSGGDCGSF